MKIHLRNILITIFIFVTVSCGELTVDDAESSTTDLNTAVETVNQLKDTSTVPIATVPIATIQPTQVPLPIPSPVFVDTELTEIDCSTIETLNSDQTIDSKLSMIVHPLEFRWDMDSASPELEIFWIDYDGNEVSFGEIKASLNVGTHVGHPWVVREKNGECVMGFMIEKSNLTDDPQNFFANVYIKDSEWVSKTTVYNPNLSDIEVGSLYPSVNSGEILFESDLHGQNGTDIYVLDQRAEPDQLIQLTNFPSNEIINETPSWSPEGILFASTMHNEYGSLEIYSMDIYGENIKRLTVSGSDLTMAYYPQFSETLGGKILYLSNQSLDTDSPYENFSIFMMNYDGTNIIQLTDPNTDEMYASWHPDGEKIIFSSNMDGQEGYDIYTMDITGSWDTELNAYVAGGSNIERLTYGGVRYGEETSYMMPKFSPDGNMIVWVDNSEDLDRWDLTLMRFFDDNGVGIYPLTSSETHPLFNSEKNPNLPTNSQMYFVGPSWIDCNDIEIQTGNCLNNKIIFSSNFNQKNNPELFEIYTMTLPELSKFDLIFDGISEEEQSPITVERIDSLCLDCDEKINSPIVTMIEEYIPPSTTVQSEYIPFSPITSSDSVDKCMASPDETMLNFFEMLECWASSTTDESSLDEYAQTKPSAPTSENEFEYSGWYGSTASTLSQNSKFWTDQIIFSSDMDGQNQMDLYAIYPDGSGLTQITSSGSNYNSPTISTKNNEMFFYSAIDGQQYGYDIYKINLDDMTTTRLTFSGDTELNSQPVISPDGTKLLYHVNVDQDSKIMIMNVDGTNPNNLIPESLYSTDFVQTFRDSNWYPDGNKIIFTSDINLDSNVPDDANSIYEINIDGTGITKLTKDDNRAILSNPVWSPDGTKIAYVSNTKTVDELTFNDMFDPKSNLMMLDPVKGNSCTVLNSPDSLESYPFWSADGTKLFFTTTYDNFTSIYSVDATCDTTDVPVHILPFDLPFDF